MKKISYKLFLSTILILFIVPFDSNFFGHQKIDGEIISASTDLSYWGIKKVSQIGYISLGIIHKKGKKELIVYDLRGEKPKIQKSVNIKTHAPELKNGFFLLDDFERGNVNRLGGYFNEFYKYPSKALTTIEKNPRNNRWLCFQFNQKEPGYSGFWIHLFDLKSPPSERLYFDASHLKYLTFCIQGKYGEEKLEVRAADHVWERKEDSLKIGDIEEFLPAGKIAPTWQRVWIPLSRIDFRIKRQSLASIVFSVIRGKGEIYIDDIAFTSKKYVLSEEKTPKKKQKKFPNKGLWLWETDSLLQNHDHWKFLISFCKSTNVNEIFLQLPYSATQNNGNWNIELDKAGLSDLLSYIHNFGIKVHALDGDPRFALKKWHPKVIATIKALIRYNTTVPQEARFDGIRYDNEPYVLPYFSGTRKKSIIKQYITLLETSSQITKNAGIEFGVDIPFWFDETNQYFKPITLYKGRPLSQWVIDSADNIGIMDYRTKAYGPDGTIAHVLGELNYAEKKGKKIWVGLETGRLPDETLLEFSKNGSGRKLFIEKTSGTNIKIHVLPEDDKALNLNGITLFETSKVMVPSEKITFFEKSIEELEKIMSKTQLELNHFSSFHGFAVHSYKSYKRMVKKQKNPLVNKFAKISK